MQPKEQKPVYRINRCYTSYGSLVALGIEVERRGILEPIREQVHIKQKVIQDTPVKKLTDALIAILAGARGLVETNKRVRPEKALQLAFGRHRCAEQSVISDTLNACSNVNVTQMQEALREIYQTHSQGYHHDYDVDWQLLDVDMTGQPCGKKAEFASKGYFANQRNRRGRQLGRVLASWYDEVVVDLLYDGKTQLPRALKELVITAAATLDLDATKRQRTIIRIDGHGGSLDDVNWLLGQRYHVHTKEYSTKRARKLAESVVTWYDDEKGSGRQFGYVTQEATEYVDIVHRIAVRTRKKNGQWGIGVLISSLSPHEVTYLAGLMAPETLSEQEILAAYVHFYDLRGGGVETAIKSDKQALGISKRNKKSFTAQQMIMQLNTLAHNLLVWFRMWMAQHWQAITRLGLLRLIRDLLRINAFVHFDERRMMVQLVINQLDPFAHQLCHALRPMLARSQIDIILGKT